MKDDEKVPEKRATDVEIDEYIIAENKYPIAEGRFGYLPISIQRFLRTDNSLCQTREKKIKKNTPCLLRCGVESSQTQSFIACIASIFSEQEKKSSMSINEMKKHIVSILNVDIFARLQNGSLIETFEDSKNVPEIDIENYK